MVAKLIGLVAREGDPVPQPTAEDYSRAIQSHIDDVARSRDYSDGVAVTSYKDDPNPAWSAQAIAFIAWRSAVWSYTYIQLGKVQAGQRQPPTISELIEELPAIAW